MDVSAVQLDARAEGLQPLKVQRDGPVANVAAAGQADLCPPPLGQQRPHDTDAGAHLANEVVLCVAVHLVLDADPDVALFLVDDGTAELFEQVGQVLGVGEGGDALEQCLALGEDRGGHDGQGGVF